MLENIYFELVNFGMFPGSVSTIAVKIVYVCMHVCVSRRSMHIGVIAHRVVCRGDNPSSRKSLNNI